MNVPLMVSKVGDKVTTVQDILNQLLPNLLPLGLTFLCIYLLKRRMSPLTILLGLFVLGIVGFWTGILA